MEKWEVPYVDLPRQFRTMEKELTDAFKKVMDAGDFILRDDVKNFEESIAEYLKAKFVVGVNSGTDALNLSAMAIGLQTGDEVITVAHTFVATIASIVHVGAEPVLVDIGDDFNIDVNLIENVITDKTKAIIPVHINGRVCQMDRIIDIADRYNLLVIEDAAQALSAEFMGKQAGTFGTIGCFSLHPMKVLGGAGDGGFVVAQNSDIHEKLAYLRNHGQRNKEDLVCYGFNSRLDNLQAAFLNVKIQYLRQWVERRRHIASYYCDELAKYEDTILLPPSPNSDKYARYDIYSSYVIRIKEQQNLFNHLRQNSVECFAHLSHPLNQMGSLNLRKFDLPNTQRIAKEILSLPINEQLSDYQVEYVIDSIGKFFD